MRTIKSVTILTAILLAVSFTASAYDNPIDGGFLEVVDNDYWGPTNELRVGITTAGNELIIRDGSELFTPYGTTIGRDSTSANNIMQVQDSLWVNVVPDDDDDDDAELLVGNGGNNNLLEITDGSKVWTDRLTIGVTQSGDGNRVVVDNAGLCVGECSDYEESITVGRRGSGNSLIITNNGFVGAWDVDIGQEVGSSNNLLHVTGGDTESYETYQEPKDDDDDESTLIVVDGDLDVGEAGSYNILLVENHGRVEIWDGDLEIGDTGSADYNTAIIRNGSEIEVDDGNVYVGKEGSYNTLFVGDDSYLYVDEDLVIGRDVGADHNAVIVQDGEIYIDDDYLYVGKEGSHNSLLIESNGYVYIDNELILGDVEGANSNSMIIRTDGSVHVDDDVLVGHYGSYNTLTVQGNNEIIEGVAPKKPRDSYLYVDKHLYVGKYGSHNSLVVESNGIVTINEDKDLEIGDKNGANSNSVIIRTGGELYAKNVVVGHDGSYNTLIVQGDDESVEAAASKSGKDSPDEDPDLDVGDTLYVGKYGSHNSLLVDSNGFVLVDDKFSIGENEGANYNSAIIRNGSALIVDTEEVYVGNKGSYNSLLVGEDSYLYVDEELYVGNEGSHNSLVVENDGVVEIVKDLIIGAEEGADSNSMIVANGGSVDANGKLYVGKDGSYNSLLVESNATVEVGNDFSIGEEEGANHNSAIIRNGSEVTVDYDDDTDGDFRVGKKGSHNTLIVEDNSFLDISGDLEIGRKDTAISNAVFVQNSEIEIDQMLYVGKAGSYNTLLVQGDNNYGGLEPRSTKSPSDDDDDDDATIYVGKDFTIGKTDSADYNTAVIDGGAVYVDQDNDSHALTVGRNGAGNRLFVINGGAVIGNDDTDLYIGREEGADFNTMTVADRGLVQVGGNLYMGLDAEDGWAEGGESNTLYLGTFEQTLAALNNTYLSESNEAFNALVDAIASTNGSIESLMENLSSLELLGEMFSAEPTFTGGTLIVGDGLDDGPLGELAELAIESGVGGLFVSSDGYDYDDDDDDNYTEVVFNNHSTVVSPLAMLSSEDQSGTLVFLRGGSTWDNGIMALTAEEDGVTALLVEDGAKLSNDLLVAISSGSPGDYAKTFIGVVGSNTVARNDIALLLDSNDCDDCEEYDVYIGDEATWEGMTYASAGIGHETLVENATMDITKGLEDSLLAQEILYLADAFNVAGEVEDLLEAFEGTVLIGAFGSGNKLTIAEGGRVEDNVGIIGAFGGEENGVEVVGGGVWQNNNALYLGGMMISTCWVSGGVGSYLDVNNEEILVAPPADGIVLSEEPLHEETPSMVLVGNVNPDSLEEYSDSNGLIVIGDTTGSPVMRVGEDSYVEAGTIVLGPSALESGTLIIDPNAEVYAEDEYIQNADSELIFNFGFAEGLENGVLDVDGEAIFENEATISQEFIGGAGVNDMNIDELYTVIYADQLIVGDETNALSGLNIRTLVDRVLTTNGLPKESKEGVEFAFVRRSIVDSGGATDGSDLGDVLDEIDDMSEEDEGAGDMINALDESGLSEEELGDLMEQLYARRMNVENAVNKGRNAAFQQMRIRAEAMRGGSSGAAPAGAAGPHAADQDLRGWIKGYATRADKDLAGAISQDIDVNGTLIGFDKTFGPLLLGVAGGYAQTDLAQTDGDRNDVTTRYGMLYAAMGTNDWFANMSLFYGMNSVDYRSGTSVLGWLEADYDSTSYAIYLGGGKEIQKDAWLITPEASMTLGYYEQDAYVERAIGDIVPKSVEAYAAWSYQTSLGLSLAYLKEFDNGVVLKPEVRAYWLHEFDADERRMDYTLVGGTQSHSFTAQAADEDMLELGAGLSVKLGDSLELRADVDMQIGESYEGITGSGRIAYEF